MSFWRKIGCMMGWLKKEKQKIAFSSVQHISYAMIMEVWVRRESSLTDDSMQKIQTLLRSSNSES